MRRVEYPGAWYADADPSGAYVVIWASGQVEVVSGVLLAPVGRLPLFPRLTTVGGFRFAGQSWDDPSVSEWVSGEGWRRIPQVAIGVSPVIYDYAGQLHISDGSIGSQGWRYVAEDGQLVTGDATYGHAGKPFTLFEWTDLSGGGDTLVIGQGPEDGCWVWDGTTHRLLADGACRFIRARRDGDQVSVAIWRIGASTIIVWATVEELRALPVVTAPVTPPVLPVEPPPVPPELPRLGITITHYAAGGPAPYHVTADYHVEGHGHSPVQVYLTLDGQRVAMETDSAGQIQHVIATPGDYLLGADVDCAGRRARTGAVRVVRVTAPLLPPSPIHTGKAGYTQAAEEARKELTK